MSSTFYLLFYKNNIIIIRILTEIELILIEVLVCLIAARRLILLQRLKCIHVRYGMKNTEEHK